MPHVAEPEAVRLHGVVASCIQGGDPAGAEAAMLAIVAETATAIREIHDDGDADPTPRPQPLPSVLARG
jgi:DNA-binding FadR family transcriptional regulator